MEDLLDRGLPFLIDDLWRPSTFADEIDEHSSIFKPLATALSPSDQPSHVKEDHTPHFDFSIDLPASSTRGSSPDIDSPSTEQHIVHSNDADGGAALEVWDLNDIDRAPNSPKLCTWEAFQKEEIANSRGLALLSEAGSAAFDAVVSAFAPENKIGILPQDYILRSLCHLVLGRASSLFQWDDSLSKFVPTLQEASISGLSDLCSAALLDSLIRKGSLLARLRKFLDDRQTRHVDAPVHTAFWHGLNTMLEAVEVSMSEQLTSVRSILQLQRVTICPFEILVTLELVVSSISSAQKSEDLISLVTNCIDGRLLADLRLRQMFDTFLARLSAPWLQKLARGLGFLDPANAILPDDPSDPVETGTIATMPAFMSTESATLVRETIEAVNLLRTQTPAHDLFTPSIDVASPFACFRDASITREIVEECANQYEERHVNITQPVYARTLTQPSSDLQWTSSSLSEVDDHADQLYQLMSLMSTDVLAPLAEQDLLHEQTMLACRNNGHQPDSSCFGKFTTPFDRVRPLVLAQKRLVDSVLLHQFYHEHQLLEHLNIHKQFHLFGNGEFITRLSIALFSVDVQSAERRRGKMPTAEPMGLRLGTAHEEQWPPASSELQLTLMGILNETNKRLDGKNTSVRPSLDRLPGGLSFAIRQLPEDDIERVLDPNSIYALDFLRLQYIAKPPLDAVFTVQALEHYDQIFRFLLRLLRLTHVTATLAHRASAASSSHKLKPSMCVFVMEARAFIAVLAAHVIDVGVNAPWREFEKEIYRLRPRPEEHPRSRHSPPVGIVQLRRLHDTCLDRMRGRLFLKRKQEKIRVEMENALSAILRTAFAVQADPAPSSSHVEADGSTLRHAVLALQSSLKDTAEKQPKDVSAPDSEDAEMAALLLSKLNWNGFYDDAG